jgi:hypothetical protein
MSDTTLFNRNIPAFKKNSEIHYKGKVFYGSSFINMTPHFSTFPNVF